MQDEVIELLSGKDLVRRLDSITLTRVSEFFCSKVNTLLEVAMQRHPLGFFYACEKISPEATLRYHVWPKDCRFADSQMGSELHDHVFSFNSLILAGKLRYETFRAVPNEFGRYALLQVTYSSAGSGLQRTDTRVELVHNSNEAFGRGTIYHLEAGVLHRATAIQKPAATLLLTENSNAHCTPHVLLEFGKGIPGAFVRSLIESNEVAEVRRILSDF